MPTRTGAPTACEYIAALAAGAVTSHELAVSYLERIAAVDPVVNGVVHVDADRVLADGDSADVRLQAGERKPLLGLPVSVKDSIAVAGMPCLSGSFAREANVPTEDATVIARLRDAGA